MQNRLKQILNYFIEKGFDYEIDSEREIVFFSKKENDTKKCIQLGCKAFEKEIKIGSSTTEYIEIDKVEEVLRLITNEQKYFKYTISGIVGVEKGGYLLEEALWVEKEKDLDNYIKKLDAYYQSYIAPFFDAVPTLQSFNDKVLSVVTFDEYHHYLSGEVGLKAMIIMHLCKNVLYTDYVNYREEEYKNSPYLHNPESRYHKISKQGFEDFNKLKAMVAKGEI